MALWLVALGTSPLKLVVTRVTATVVHQIFQPAIWGICRCAWFYLGFPRTWNDKRSILNVAILVHVVIFNTTICVLFSDDELCNSFEDHWRCLYICITLYMYTSIFNLFNCSSHIHTIHIHTDLQNGPDDTWKVCAEKKTLSVGMDRWNMCLALAGTCTNALHLSAVFWTFLHGYHGSFATHDHSGPRMVYTWDNAHREIQCP